MAVLSDITLQRLSDWVERMLLKDTCDILRETTTLLPSGGRQSTGWTPCNTQPVPCALLAQGSPSEQRVASQLAGSITKLVLLPRGTDVRGSDRIQKDGIIYQVVGPLDPTTFEVTRRVLVVQRPAS